MRVDYLHLTIHINKRESIWNGYSIDRSSSSYCAFPLLSILFNLAQEMREQERKNSLNDAKLIIGRIRRERERANSHYYHTIEVMVPYEQEKERKEYSLSQTRRKDQQFRYVIERKFFSGINWRSAIIYLVFENNQNIIR